MVLPVIPVMIALAFWFRQRILLQYREVRKQNSLITGAYNENITGVRVVKALAREQRDLEDFKLERRDVSCCLPCRLAVCAVPPPDPDRRRSVRGPWSGTVGLRWRSPV